MFKINKIKLLTLLILFTGCFEKVIYLETPQIYFKEIKYVDSGVIDSILLTFTIDDESGDIGLHNDEVEPPYNYSYGVIDGKNNILTTTGTYTPPYYQVPITRSTYRWILEDSLNSINQQKYRSETREMYVRQNEFVYLGEEDPRPKTFGCYESEETVFYFKKKVNDIYSILDSDTVEIFILLNPFHYNIHVTFETKKKQEFQEIDFNSIFNTCIPGFNGRIPYFQAESRSGTYTYIMQSAAFAPALLDDSIRIQFFVYDRALNKSNVAYTNPFVLYNITQ